MTTIQTMIGRVRGFLNEPSDIDQKFYTDAEIIDYLQIAVDELCLETDINYRVYNYTNATVVDNLTFVELSGNIESYLYKVKWLLVQDSDRSDNGYDDLLRVVPQANESYPDTTNKDYSCIIYDNTIFLNKDLKVGDKILLGGRWRKPLLTADGAFPLDPIAEDACVKYATHLGFLKKQKIETAAGWLALWQQRKQIIKDTTEELTQSKYPKGLTVRKTKNSNRLNGFYGSIPN